MSYDRELQDPRWQRLRLEVFQRDGFKCICCGDDKTELQAHHIYYISGRRKWQYPIEALETLCAHCHHDVRAREEASAESGAIFKWEQLFIDFWAAKRDCFLIDTWVRLSEFFKVTTSDPPAKHRNETTAKLLSVLQVALVRKAEKTRGVYGLEDSDCASTG